jgi:HAD superfamily phosphoserine phosphatase-like hydrolase
MTGREGAAFFRVEGALSPRPTALAAATLAANAQGLGERLFRLGAAPLALVPLQDTRLSARLTWLSLRGMSEDRLVILGEEFFSAKIAPNLRPVGLELARRARADGLRVVLVSDSLDVVMGPLAALIGAQDLICNRLELRDGRATGRLIAPVIGRFGGRPLREYADNHGIDLAASRAFGASSTDTPLLSAAGFPCAVHPDRALRSMAQELDWPVREDR